MRGTSPNITIKITRYNTNKAQYEHNKSQIKTKRKTINFDNKDIRVTSTRYITNLH